MVALDKHTQGLQRRGIGRAVSIKLPRPTKLPITRNPHQAAPAIFADSSRITPYIAVRYRAMADSNGGSEFGTLGLSERQ